MLFSIVPGRQLGPFRRSEDYRILIIGGSWPYTNADRRYVPEELSAGEAGVDDHRFGAGRDLSQVFIE